MSVDVETRTLLGGWSVTSVRPPNLKVLVHLHSLQVTASLAYLKDEFHIKNYFSDCKMFQNLLPKIETDLTCLVFPGGERGRGGPGGMRGGRGMDRGAPGGPGGPGGFRGGRGGDRGGGFRGGRGMDRGGFGGRGRGGPPMDDIRGRGRGMGPPGKMDMK